MAPKSAIVLLFGIMSTVLAAPVPQTGVDRSVLLQNAQEAQRLNTEFQSLKKSDPCQDKEVACINGEGTICVNGRWMIEERCPRRETCFALPLLESSGTTISCASEQEATQIFQQAGVDSPFSDNNSTITPPPANIVDNPNNNNGSQTTTVSSSPTASTTIIITLSNSQPANVVTSTREFNFTTPTSLPPFTTSTSTTASVTTSSADVIVTEPQVTQTITQFIPVPISEGTQTTVTLPPETRTISPGDASSILSLISSSATATEADIFTTVTNIPISLSTSSTSVSSAPISTLTPAPSLTLITVSAPGATDTASSTASATGDAVETVSPTPILTLTPARPTQSAT